MRHGAHDPLGLDDPQHPAGRGGPDAVPAETEGAVRLRQHRGHDGEAVLLDHQALEAVDGGESPGMPLQHRRDLPAPPGQSCARAEGQRGRPHRGAAHLRRQPAIAGGRLVLRAPPPAAPPVWAAPRPRRRRCRRRDKAGPAATGQTPRYRQMRVMRPPSPKPYRAAPLYGGDPPTSGGGPCGRFCVHDEGRGAAGLEAGVAKDLDERGVFRP